MPETIFALEYWFNTISYGLRVIILKKKGK